MAAAAASGGGSGSGGSGADGDKISMTLAYEDVVWERDGRGDKVMMGRGASGIVYAGRLHGQQVAIKAEVLEPGEEEAWLKAVRLQKSATCPHIVAVHGIIVDRYGSGVTHHVVMERLAGTMTALLLKPGGAHYGADMELRFALLANVAAGLAYLHAASVIHADVKPDNVLLTAVSRWSPYPIAKLADFGESVQRRAGTDTSARATLVGERGTVVYMDPALLDGSASLKAASDVYSFGVMAWQVLSGLQPYAAELAATAPVAGMDSRKLLKAHVCGLSGKRPPVAALAERGVPPAVVALVQACWAPAQASRPTMAAVHNALEAAVVWAGAAGGSGGAAPAPAPSPVPLAVTPAAAQAPAATPTAAQLSAAAPVSASDTSAVAAPVRPGTPDPEAAGPAPLAYSWDDQLELRGHSSGVCSLALLPGGRLASGDTGGTVRLWDVACGGEATAVLEGPGGIVKALAALPDGRRLAAGVWGSDGKVGAIVVWDTGVTPPTRSITIDFDGGVHALAVLHDGRLAAGCFDCCVRLVEVGADVGAVVATLSGHAGLVAALAVLPDGTLASGSGDHTVRLWDVGAAPCSVATLAGHTRDVSALAVLPGGRLASGSYNYSVRLWDVDARACIGLLKGHADRVWALAALADGRLASGSLDNTIRVWDTRPGVIAAGEPTGGIMVTVTRLWRRTAPTVVLEGHTSYVRALAALPGGRLASGSWDNTVRLWRLPS